MNSDLPLVSVIVPNYNHEKYLRQRLESIFNQTYSNIEVILLDDCSNDDSREVLSSYANHPKVSYCVFNEINSGNTFTQWNKGIQLAKGDFIWIAESDDFCDLDFLEEITKSLIDNEKVVLSYCQSNQSNEIGEVTGTWLGHTQNLKGGDIFNNNFLIQGSIFINDFLIHKNVIPNASAVVFRRDKVEIDEHLKIDPNFKYCGDWIFYFRLLFNYEVSFISRSMNNFRYHSNSVISCANTRNNFIELKNLDLKMREEMMFYLSQYDLKCKFQIINSNKKIVQGLLLEQAQEYHRQKATFKEMLLYVKYPDLVFLRYNFRKKISQVLKKLLN